MKLSQLTLKKERPLQSRHGTVPEAKSVFHPTHSLRRANSLLVRCSADCVECAHVTNNGARALSSFVGDVVRVPGVADDFIWVCPRLVVDGARRPAIAHDLIRFRSSDCSSNEHKCKTMLISLMVLPCPDGRASPHPRNKEIATIKRIMRAVGGIGRGSKAKQSNL